MSNNNEGPQIQDIPAKRNFVCTGCKWLLSEGYIRGHTCSTNNYYCLHPDAKVGRLHFPQISERLQIYYNRDLSLPVLTPSGCPVMPENKEWINKIKEIGK